MSLYWTWQPLANTLLKFQFGSKLKCQHAIIRWNSLETSIQMADFF